MLRQEFRRLICVSVMAALALGLSSAQSQEIDNTDAYALANQLADELELVRERTAQD